MTLPSNPPELYVTKVGLTELEKKDKVFELIRAGLQGDTAKFGNSQSYYVARAREYVDLIYGAAK